MLLVVPVHWYKGGFICWWKYILEITWPFASSFSFNPLKISVIFMNKLDDILLQIQLRNEECLKWCSIQFLQVKLVGLVLFLFGGNLRIGKRGYYFNHMKRRSEYLHMLVSLNFFLTCSNGSWHSLMFLLWMEQYFGLLRLVVHMGIHSSFDLENSVSK